MASVREVRSALLRTVAVRAVARVAREKDQRSVLVVLGAAFDEAKFAGDVQGGCRWCSSTDQRTSRAGHRHRGYQTGAAGTAP